MIKICPGSQYGMIGIGIHGDRDGFDAFSSNALDSRSSQVVLTARQSFPSSGRDGCDHPFSLTEDDAVSANGRNDIDSFSGECPKSLLTADPL